MNMVAVDGSDVSYADDSERALDQSFWRRFPSRSRFFEDVWKATRGSDILLANLLNARQDDASCPAAIHWCLRGEWEGGLGRHRSTLRHVELFKLP